MDLKFFVKVIFVIPKKENLLRSFYNKLDQKRVELLRESVRNDGKGL